MRLRAVLDMRVTKELVIQKVKVPGASFEIRAAVSPGLHPTLMYCFCYGNLRECLSFGQAHKKAKEGEVAGAHFGQRKN